MARAAKTEKEQLAEERTEAAADRTVLANERTYTAWVRTGLAALVAGLAVLRFMEAVMPRWSLKLVALALILYSLFCFGAGVWRYRHTGRRLAEASVRQIAPTALIVATAILVAAALTALVSMWLVDMIGSGAASRGRTRASDVAELVWPLQRVKPLKMLGGSPAEAAATTGERLFSRPPSPSWPAAAPRSRTRAAPPRPTARAVGASAPSPRLRPRGRPSAAAPGGWRTGVWPSAPPAPASSLVPSSLQAARLVPVAQGACRANWDQLPLSGGGAVAVSAAGAHVVDKPRYTEQRAKPLAARNVCARVARMTHRAGDDQ